MIVLASASPRRRELLSLLTEDFVVEPSNADESCDIPQATGMVRFLAHKKAADIFAKHPGDVVIGADTLVQAPGGEIFGKPKDLADARRMLEALSGSTHRVHTGVCVMYQDKVLEDVSTSEVCFAKISEAELGRYLEREDVMDKAGAYAIQGSAAKFVKSINGCFFNIVGLPVSMLYGMLTSLSVL
ncbi:Maf family protein [Christensenella timonensis]|uniref:Maf family protein n=1 Tax=Christensenella timonensis TaxID=1816678 RepID=UPI000833C65C|nr:Maf family protein [Christensenella timonensis]